MDNQFIHPTASLSPYIRQYIYIRADGSTDTMTPPEGDHHFVDGLHVEKVLPHCGHLLFVRGAEVRYGDVENHADCIYIGGPHRVTIDLVTLHGWFEALMVEFHPGGMHSLLGYDMSRLKDKILTTDMLADESLHQVGLAVSKVSTATEAASLLDSFFLSRLNTYNSLASVDPLGLSDSLAPSPCPPRPLALSAKRALGKGCRVSGGKGALPLLSRVISALDESCASLSVAEMASLACMSDRQFRRIFSEYIGLTPKEFIRIERFHLALRYMQMCAHNPQLTTHNPSDQLDQSDPFPHPIDLMSVVVRFGYYDLSHLASEFRALGCTTPLQFRRLGIPIQPDFSVFFA